MAEEGDIQENYALSLVETEFNLTDDEAIFPNKEMAADHKFGKASPNTEIKQRHALSLEMRIHVLKDNEAGLSHRQLATKYKCGRTQISTIMRQKEELLKEWATNADRGRKRKRSEPYEEVNEMVWEWFQKAKIKQIPINGPILQAKAKEYAYLLEIQAFSASNGWLNSFCKRHSISFRKINNKERDTDQEEVRDWRSRISTILNEYSPRDIYNIHETGLLFRTMPNEDLSSISKICEGGNLARERLTIGFCCNAIGEKEFLFVISKHFTPWCLKGINLSNYGVKWYPNKKAWLTGGIFKDFMQTLNERMKSQCRKIVIFMDDIPCHHAVTDLSHIFVKFLPSSTTGVVQPLDLGIIDSFKQLYRSKLLKNLTARVSKSENMKVISEQINVLQAIKWVALSWNAVRPELITKCFKISGIMSDFKSSMKGVINLDAEFMRVCELAGISNIEISEDIQCFEMVNSLELDSLPKSPTIPVESTELEEHQVEGSEDDTEKEDEELGCLPLPLNDSLRTISQLRKLLHKHCLEKNQLRVFDAIDVVEAELEDIIIKNKLQTNLK